MALHCIHFRSSSFNSFISGPEVAAELRKEDIFLIPLGEGASAGLRVAICAIPEEKISGLARKIKAAMERVG